MAESSFAQTRNAAKEVAGGNRLVSIIVVNYNGSKWLRGCLDSLAKATYPALEVVLVDNASSDDSLRLLEDYPRIRVVRNTQNLGFAGGNNVGLAHCSGEYVLLLNNDTVVSPDFLEPLCHYLDEHPQIGAVQGKMILPRYAGTLDVCGSFLTAFGLPYHYGYYKPDGPKYNRSFPVFSGKGACLMFRRALIKDVGGFLFDDDFFCYYEESDFCHRVWLAGYQVHFVPGPPVQHFMGATAGGPHEVFVLRHYLRNMAFSLMSNLSFRSRLRIMPLFFSALLSSLALSALKLKWGQARAHGQVITHCLKNYKKIRNRRKTVKALRKEPDQQLFRKVLRTPRLNYFVKTATGKLAEYQDEVIEEDKSRSLDKRANPI